MLFFGSVRFRIGLGIGEAAIIGKHCPVHPVLKLFLTSKNFPLMQLSLKQEINVSK